MVDGLDRLRHDAIVRRDDQHGDIRRLGAASTHRSKRLVARGIQEGNRTALALRGVRADVLSDAARFARRHMRLADVVEQRGLAVIDVAHDGDDRRTRQKILLVVLDLDVLGEHVLRCLFDLLFELDAELGTDQLRRVVIQLLVDRGHDAQQQQLLDDFARGLADALGQVLDRDRLGGHVRLFDLDRRHQLLRGLHLALPASAAHDIVVHADAVLAHHLLAVARHALRVMLALIKLLVRVVIGNALLLDRRGQLRPLAAAHAGTRAHRTPSGLAAHGACAALRLLAVRTRALALTS